MQVLILTEADFRLYLSLGHFYAVDFRLMQEELLYGNQFCDPAKWVAVVLLPAEFCIQAFGFHVGAKNRIVTDNPNHLVDNVVLCSC